MMFALAWRVLWAVGTAGYMMAACAAAGHPGVGWHGGIWSCTCGRTWPE